MSPAGKLLGRLGAAGRGWQWARHELAGLRTTLVPDGLYARVAPPPTTARGSFRGTQAALRTGRASCLERSLVIQAWLLARGLPHEIIVGVRSPDRPAGDDIAHAWIDGWDADCSAEFHEIRRVAPR